MQKLFAVLLCFVIVISSTACTRQAPSPDSEPAPAGSPGIPAIEYIVSTPDKPLAPAAGSQEIIPDKPLAPNPDSSGTLTFREEPIPLTEPALSVAGVESEMLRLINSERSVNGLSALTTDDTMCFAAKIRAEELKSSFSHTRPSGGRYYTAFDEAGFSYAGFWHGENLSMIEYSGSSYDSATVAQKMFDALKDSPGHYENMVSENYTIAGIGAYLRMNGDRTHVYSAQLFAGN